MNRSLLRPSLLVVMVGVLSVLTGISARGDVRALWVKKEQLTSPERIHKFVAWAKEGGYNTLFVQVRARGSTFYPSQIESLSDEAHGLFDPLALVLQEAHQGGLTVHAWVNVYYVWSQNQLPADMRHSANRHPEWILATGDGFFLDPANPAVSDYLIALIDEITQNYPVDGIHMDYVRFPLASEVPAAHRNAVTRFVKKCHDHLKATAPSVALSAAVIMPLERARSLGQPWDEWIRDGALDFVVPMAYTGRPDRFALYLKTLSQLPPTVPCVVGIGAYLNTEREWRNQIAQVMHARHPASPLSGFSLFSYDSLMNADEIRGRVGE